MKRAENNANRKVLRLLLLGMILFPAAADAMTCRPGLTESIGLEWIADQCATEGNSYTYTETNLICQNGEVRLRPLWIPRKYKNLTPQVMEQYAIAKAEAANHLVFRNLPGTQFVIIHPDFIKGGLLGGVSLAGYPGLPAIHYGVLPGLLLPPPGVVDVDNDGTFACRDCNDNDAFTSPAARELCNDYVDNNCNDLIDCQEPSCFSKPVCNPCSDQDGDGFSLEGGDCGPADCNDADPASFPGAPELCDNRDNNCNGSVDEGLSFDLDHDGHFSPGSCFTPHDDCDDADPAVYPGAPELCDAKDNNCDGSVDEGLSFDLDHDGHFTPGSCFTPHDDCDDADPAVFPGSQEICWDGRDNDCSPQTLDACCTLAIKPAAPGWQEINPAAGETIHLAEINEEHGEDYNWMLQANGRELSSGSGWKGIEVFWNGRYGSGNLAGKNAEPGRYTALLEAQTADGRCRAAAEVALQVEWRSDPQLNVVFGSTANVASGGLLHELPLFATSGSGPNVELSLFYHSLDPHAGPLGLGWSHSYDILTKERENGDVLLKLGNGDRRLYLRSGERYISQIGDDDSLQKQADGTFVLHRKEGSSWSFNQNGRLTRMEDRNGNLLSFSYADDLLVSIAEPSGRRTTSLEYDQNGRLRSITDPAGRTFSLRLADGLLTGIELPGGRSWHYSYDAQGFLRAATDPGGYATSFAYDAAHRVQGSTDPGGWERRIEYPAASIGLPQASRLLEQDGSTWEYLYHPGTGNLLKRTDPLGRTISFTHDEDGNLLSRTGPAGHTTSYGYDANGNLIRRVDALGYLATFDHNRYGQVTSATDPLGNSIRYEYDENGNLLAASDPSGGVTRYQYDGSGRMTGEINPSGGLTSYQYDRSGNLAAIINPVGEATTYTYDALGRLLSRTDQAGCTSRMEYNHAGKLAHWGDCLDQITTFEYDLNGNCIGVSDANGNTTRFLRDYQGKPVLLAEATGAETIFVYGTREGFGPDKPDNLTGVVDAKGRSILLSYDALGRLTTVTDPQDHRASYEYDPAGNLSRKTDARGNTITFSYDAAGRLLTRSYPDGTSTDFTYDGAGNLISARNQHIAYQLDYDAAGRLLSATDSDGLDVSYAYDAAGHRQRLTLPSGETVEYRYDLLGKLTAISARAGEFLFHSDAAGRRTALEYPNGVQAFFSYDPLGRPEEIFVQSSGKRSKTLVAALGYGYDPLGNILLRTTGDGQGPPLLTAYSYDPAYRLLEAVELQKNGRHHEKQGANAEIFSYDLMGNRLNGPRWHDVYRYDALDHLEEDSWYRYSYDAQGNRVAKVGLGEHSTADDLQQGEDRGKEKHRQGIERPAEKRHGLQIGDRKGHRDENREKGRDDRHGKQSHQSRQGHREETARHEEHHEAETGQDGSWSYAYDFEDRLIRAEGREGDETTIITYAYDPFGRLLEKRVETMEDRDSEVKTFRYVYDRNELVLELRTSDEDRHEPAVTSYLHDPEQRQPLAVEQKKRFYSFHHDVQGSIVALTDSRGKVVQTQEYSGFGLPKKQGGKVKQPFGFLGLVWEPELKLYHRGAAWYDPLTDHLLADSGAGWPGGNTGGFPVADALFRTGGSSAWGSGPDPIPQVLRTIVWPPGGSFPEHLLRKTLGTSLPRPVSPIPWLR